MKASPKSTQKSAKNTIGKGKASKGFTEEERAAIRERAKEMSGKGEGESVVLEKIAAMKAPDRALAERLHAIIKANAPALTPRLWYGMPAYAKDDKVVCYFQDAQKFKARYASLWFTDKANLDDGSMWPIGYALKEMTLAEGARISALLKKGLS